MPFGPQLELDKQKLISDARERRRTQSSHIEKPGIPRDVYLAIIGVYVISFLSCCGLIYGAAYLLKSW